jgi:2-haloacid dehalogenase
MEVDFMLRREFLGVFTSVSASALTAPALAAPESRLRPPIRAICFDLLTIFDPRSVVRVAQTLMPTRGLELWNAWKTRQFEYSWLRASASKYVDFETVTAQALTYAAKELKLSVSPADQRRLVDSYSELEPWPDARDALLSWKSSGLKLAPLTNFSPKMINRLLDRSGFGSLFDVLLSTDRAKTYKPDPRAYALGPTVLRLPREQIAFSAFGSWDAAGAKWFGFPTFWLNRLGGVGEELVPPDAWGADFAAMASWLATVGHAGEYR